MVCFGLVLPSIKHQYKHICKERGAHFFVEFHDFEQAQQLTGLP